MYNPHVDLTCPACAAPDLITDRQGNIDCDYCGTHLVTKRTECPACGELNDQGADTCSKCSEPLSIVASVIDRQGTTGRPLWIRRLRTQVADLKEREARASANRFEQLMDIDRRRKSAAAEALAGQQRKDRNILFYGGAAALGMVFVLLLLAAIL